MRNLGTGMRRCGALFAMALVMCANLDSAVADTSRRRVRKPKLQIKSLVLADAISRKGLSGYSPLAEGAIVNLATLPTRNINLSATANRKVKSVKFLVDGQVYSIDSAKPFFIAENKASKVRRRRAAAASRRGRKKRKPKTTLPPAIWPVTPGLHTITAIPYPRVKGKGKPGAPVEMSLSIIEELVIDTAAPPIPKLAEWEENMKKWGAFHCDAKRLNELGTWEGNAWYYDGMRAYFQIADYTKDPSWNDCAHLVRDIYRGYVLRAGGLVPGWRVFPHGLYTDFVRFDDVQSRDAVLLLASKSAYAFLAGAESYEYSRETAYIMSAYMFAEKLGQPLDPDIRKSAEFALGHLDQWISGSTEYVQPYLVALTVEGLIQYYDRTRDARVPAAIKRAADWLWSTTWDSQSRSFRYIICKPGATYQECGQDYGPANDLNLLIAPMYAWLYRTTGESRYQEIGDEIWEAGIAEHFLGYGKQFVQNYRWSFDYVMYRLGAQNR